MSDPSSLNIPIHTALTSDMMLGLKPSAPRSRSYRINIAPLNKNIFVGGDQMIFELPTGRRGTWLDQSQSYLKFSVQCTTTAAASSQALSTGVNIENTAYSFIQRFDLYHSSNLLESINEYGQLSNFLIDTSLTQSDKAGLSAMIGSNGLNSYYALSSSYVSPATYAASTTYPITSTAVPIQVAGDRSGQSIATTTSMSTAVPYTYCLPLLSGVIGVNASKMLPMGILASPLRLEMYLSANDDAIYYGTAGAGAVWQIVNAELVVCYVELQDDLFDHQAGPDEVEYISTTTYRQASSILPTATSGEYTTMLPFRAASITGLYARFRPYVSAVQGANSTAAYRKSSSVNPNFSQYYFRIGSSIYPNKPVYLLTSLVGNGSEGYAELLKSFHALSSSIGNSSLTYSQYNVTTTATSGMSANIAPASQATAVGTSNNAFGIGLECQSFSNRNDTILSGISTLNSQIYFTANIYPGSTAAANFTCDFFAQMDMILCIQNGIMRAKF